MKAFWICLSLLLSVAPATAIQLSDGESAFNGPLRLLRAAVTQNTVENFPVYYQFAIEAPAKLDEPLARIDIALPTEAGPYFGLYLPNPNQVRAFIPTDPYAQKPQEAARTLPIEATVNQSLISVRFLEPVAPGSVVTVEWGPVRNPSLDGNYLFSLTTFPPGPAPRGMYIGIGRIVIRSGGKDG